MYLGVSVKAPGGRWAVGKDVTWYTKLSQADEERIKKIKEEKKHHHHHHHHHHKKEKEDKKKHINEEIEAIKVF